MEMLGFKNFSQSFRADSEELFKRWLTNGENHGCLSSTIATRARQASRRISTEQSNLSTFQKRRIGGTEFQQNASMVAGASQNLNQHLEKNVAKSSWQPTNLFLAKAWFHSSQPMTRSRSSELRKRYAAMQNFQTSVGVDTTLAHNLHESENDVNQKYANLNGISHATVCDDNQLDGFASPSNSSSSAFSTPQMTAADKISSVVSMLKGTLERKKLNNKLDREAVHDSYIGFYDAEGLDNMNLDGRRNHVYEMQGNFQDVPLLQVSDADVLQEVEGSFIANLAGNLPTVNPVHMSIISQEPSQSESSAAAPLTSTAHNAFDDPNNSAQEPTVCESSRKQYGHRKPTAIREGAYDNLPYGGKKRCLVRHGSVTSACSVEQGDPTKKRRVERSRKMAEAKGRSSAPSIPSDTQSLLKLCENLEKEVRSLKLNLAFMNRKDSEQTKQIEELQKEKQELAEEKERLLEEIERTGKPCCYYS